MGDFNDAIVNQTAHRPWPMPHSPWAMTQTWNDLLFAHWPVEVSALQALVPAAFSIDTFQSQAWLGVVPFHMTNVAPRFVPALPGISAFAELNVRTYVRVGDKPGVYFFSLDAANPLAVQTARTLLNLPYYTAAMRVDVKDRDVRYASRRSSEPAAQFQGAYRGLGDVRAPLPGTLEYFLTERYCLYAVEHGGSPYRLEIHHPPWPLESAQAEIAVNTMAAAAGITLPQMPPLLHFAKRQDMVGWLPQRL
jgi:uncharacterized protein